MLNVTRTGAVTALFALVSSSAWAADPIVKPAPTPAPNAGPTIAAANAFCGDKTDKAEALIARYSADSSLQQVYSSSDYVAYGDDKANPTVMYTFTTKGHVAHPAAVCRKIVTDDKVVTIKMEVVCDGDAEACVKLRNDFNVMTAKMQAAVDQKISAGKQ